MTFPVALNNPPVNKFPPWILPDTLRAAGVNDPETTRLLPTIFPVVDIPAVPSSVNDISRIL